MDDISQLLKKPPFMDSFSKKDLESSEIMKYYRGKTIFITGATGFLGQLYVEKLLRSGVERIYMLARAKKDKTPEQRIKETFTGVPFIYLMRDDPNFWQRLTIIEGDMAELGVGIKPADLELLRENVEVVIHAAADVRFNEELIKLLLVNLRGTRELLLLAETFRKLQIFAYISTAFSNCARGHDIYEKFYEPPMDPDIMISLAERVRDNPAELEVLCLITDRIIKPWPNTYTYTKSLSEDMVRRFGQKLPCIVVRPSIVVSTYQEPVPGWANNIYGLSGVLVACGLGFIRMLPLNTKITGDIVCADVVINSTLAAIWAMHHDNLKQQTKEAKVFVVGSSKDNPLTWGMISSLMHSHFEAYPGYRILWRVCFNTTVCPFMFRLNCILYHFVPGLLFDLVLKLKGKKLRVLPHYRKVQIFLTALQYFMTTEWVYDNTNMRRVMDRMNSVDQDFFFCDLYNFDFVTWSRTYMHGLKLYVGRESADAETQRKGYAGYRQKQILHAIVLVVYYALYALFFYGVAKATGLVGYVHKTFDNVVEIMAAKS